MNSITNFVAAKQVIVWNTTEFFDSSPKWWEPNERTHKVFAKPRPRMSTPNASSQFFFKYNGTVLFNFEMEM
jgi:hypothetical protein